MITFDVCINDCLIFTGEYHQKSRCGHCKKSRYEETMVPDRLKRSTTPQKRLWYFSIGPRLQCLFLCPKVARRMTWHLSYKDRENYEELIHPACSGSWKHFDQSYPAFEAESQNVRLDLCTDGLNPYNIRLMYSVFLTGTISHPRCV